MRIAAVALVLVFMLGTLGSTVPSALEKPTIMRNPSSGVDVRVLGATVEYTNSVDESRYKMFSSNHPIFGFNRPQELFVIDGMVNVSATLSITVENLGTNPSGVVDVNVVLLHDEYTYFEISNSTVQMASLAGGAENTVTVNIVPSYAGNHTLQITSTSTV